MSAVLRVIVILCAFLVGLNAKSLQEKPSSDESKLSSLDNSANAEHLANDPAKEYNDSEEETDGKRIAFGLPDPN